MGIEPTTSRTQSENHATRPLTHVIIYNSNDSIIRISVDIDFWLTTPYIVIKQIIVGSFIYNQIVSICLVARDTANLRICYPIITYPILSDILSYFYLFLHFLHYYNIHRWYQYRIYTIIAV